MRFIFTGGFNASNYVDAPHSNFLSFEKFLANVGAFLGHPKLLAYISNIRAKEPDSALSGPVYTGRNSEPRQARQSTGGVARGGSEFPPV